MLRNLNINRARKIAIDYANHFDLPECMVYYQNKLQDGSLGLYFGGTRPSVIIIAISHIKTNKEKERLGLLLHELAHHLTEWQYDGRFESMHGESYQLAKKRTINWARKRFGNLPYDKLLSASPQPLEKEKE